jgi:hypothetical protein
MDAGQESNENAQKEAELLEKLPKAGRGHFSQSNIFSHLQNANGQLLGPLAAANLNLFSCFGLIGAGKN